MSVSARPPADVRRVVLIVGPPGAGKSTLAREMAEREGLSVFEAERTNLREAADSIRRDPHARAVVVRCCSTQGDQTKWEAAADVTETVVLDVDPDECARRIHQRGRPKWRGEVKAALEWRTRRATEGMTSRDW